MPTAAFDPGHLLDLLEGEVGEIVYRCAGVSAETLE
jgi:hypothetical protein